MVITLDCQSSNPSSILGSSVCLWRYRLSAGHVVFIHISRVRLPVAL